MSFFTLRNPLQTSATELPPAVAEAWALYEELDRSQWSSAAEIEARQLAEIRHLLEHCRQHVPFYAALLQEVGIVPQDIRALADFRRVPIISRRVWQERAGELQARQLPPDTWLTAKSTTSGTSGVKLEVRQTNVVHRWWWACNLRDLEWCGIDPRGTLAAIRPPVFPYGPDQLRQYQTGLTFPEWFPGLNGLLQTGECYGLDIQQSPTKQLEWLQRVAPNYILSYPSNLDMLSNLLREQNIRLPNLRAIQSVSETLTPDVQSRIEAAFGVPVKDQYSCAEAGYVASPCPEGHGYHVHAEHVLLEVLDAHDQPCAPGQTGRLVLTALHNYLNPFIRYEIQDDATVGAVACPCGRGLPLLKRIEGKSRPFFQLADGRLKASSNILFGLYDLHGYHQYQIIQRAVDRVTVRIVPDQDWTTEHPEKLRGIVNEFFEQPVTTEVELVERIERPVGGKVRDLICELPAPPTTSHESQTAKSGHISEAFHGKTVLFAWELGGGLGHVQQLLPLARALTAHGLRAVFAVKEPGQAGMLLEDQGFEVLQAPVFREQPATQPTGFAASYADILTRHGFAQIDELRSRLQSWQFILDRVQPDLIACDHSPTLCLASYGVIPTVTVGNGFTVPPIGQPTFPVLIPGQPLQVSEEQILAVVRQVQQERGRRAPQTLPGIFAAAANFVTAIPELDPYQPERTEPVVGPLDRLGAPVLPPEQPSYFAYLNGSQAGVEVILAGLLHSGYPGQVYLRDLPPLQRDAWRQSGLTILDRMPHIGEVLSRASVLVHHAGGGTSQHALAIGRPQFLFPTHLEQILNSQFLQGLGVGFYNIPFGTPEVIAIRLRHLLTTPQFAEQAWARACELQARGLNDALPRVLAHCFAQLKSIRDNSTQH
ncbi:MAG: nucleotide disphospho-sugar-binding domain-containing protein [Planctomycetota bacterium]